VVLTDLSSKPIASWTKDDRGAASRVYSTYDVAGILIRRGLVPKDLFVNNWGESIVRCYEVLEPFLQELHAEARRAQYGRHFEWLREQAQRHGYSSGV
jgi:hypothetical protein